MTLTIEELVELGPVIPLVRIEEPEDAVPLAAALLAGGLQTIEIDLGSPAALDAIYRIACELPSAIVGAGAVLRAEQVGEAVGAGARFLASPAATPRLLDALSASGTAFMPGAATPSEVLALLERGTSVTRLFPAQALYGLALLRALAGPFPEMRFCPCGGIDQRLAVDYLALENVCCVAGSWMLPSVARDWGLVQARARTAAALGAPPLSVAS
jgi:2-dehydro-3-deoxyphosphogluconate aldolase / (4S)-4-hydroxy-2-oxoglutarate aldolase